MNGRLIQRVESDVTSTSGVQLIALATATNIHQNEPLLSFILSRNKKKEKETVPLISKSFTSRILLLKDCLDIRNGNEANKNTASTFSDGSGKLKQSVV